MQQRVPWRLSFNTPLSCIRLAKGIRRVKTQKEFLQLQYSCVHLQSIIYDKYRHIYSNILLAGFTSSTFNILLILAHVHNLYKHQISLFIQFIQELELEAENSQDSTFTFFHCMMLLELEQRKRQLVEICKTHQIYCLNITHL